MLVIIVAVLSLALNAQGPVPGPGGVPRPNPSRASHPGGGPASRVPRRPTRERPEKPERPERPERGASRGERAPHPDAAPSGPPLGGQPPLDEPSSLADVRPLNSQATALVISVVDERKLGPVTRSRLTLRVEPVGAEAFEVTTRFAFPTPEDRAKVKVGGMIAVRYDSEDHRRVVVDTDGEGQA